MNNLNQNANASKSKSTVYVNLSQDELNAIARKNCSHLEKIEKHLEQIKWIVAWLLTRH